MIQNESLIDASMDPRGSDTTNTTPYSYVALTYFPHVMRSLEFFDNYPVQVITIRNSIIELRTIKIMKQF